MSYFVEEFDRIDFKNCKRLVTKEAVRKRATQRLYLTDTYQMSLPWTASRVLQIEHESTDPTSQKYAILLDATIMHPQGGGQPSDKGILKTGDSEFHVEKVENRGDKVWHIGYFMGDERKGFRVGVHVKSKIDGERRAHNARNHSAGHLLDEAIQNLGLTHLKQIKGYYYPNRPYVEF